ncbi:DUF397 domain-containing protein [Streptomyces xanthochromogenes]|uniref:DUF397 domain-containing protein n=1 Tax=Streptomyces xanthochromogenes TaxID=67384 RepID=UPI003823F882
MRDADDFLVEPRKVNYCDLLTNYKGFGQPGPPAPELSCQVTLRQFAGLLDARPTTVDLAGTAKLSHAPSRSNVTIGLSDFTPWCQLGTLLGDFVLLVAWLGFSSSPRCNPIWELRSAHFRPHVQRWCPAAFEKERIMMVQNGAAASSIPGAEWVKAQASNGDGNCVELTKLGTGVGVRNSRFPEGPALVYTREEVAAFLDGAKAGEFDYLID